MHYIAITCNVKFVALHLTSTTWKTCNALQCNSTAFSITSDLATGNVDPCEVNEFLHDDWLLLNLHLSN